MKLRRTKLKYSQVNSAKQKKHKINQLNRSSPLTAVIYRPRIDVTDNRRLSFNPKISFTIIRKLRITTYGPA